MSENGSRPDGLPGRVRPKLAMRCAIVLPRRMPHRRVVSHLTSPEATYPRITRYGWYGLAGAFLACLVAASLAVPAVADSFNRGQALAQMSSASAELEQADEAVEDATCAILDARLRAAIAVIGRDARATETLRSLARVTLDGQLDGEIFPQAPTDASSPVLPTTPQGMRGRAEENAAKAADQRARADLYRARAEEISRATAAL